MTDMEHDMNKPKLDKMLLKCCVSFRICIFSFHNSSKCKHECRGMKLMWEVLQVTTTQKVICPV